MINFGKKLIKTAKYNNSLLQRLTLKASFSQKPPGAPMNPTMAESFGTKVSKKDLQNLMNPIGFLDEKEYQHYEGVDKASMEAQNAEELAEKLEKLEEKAQQKKEVSDKEYGFKVKGPEPTRYGDWERNGRCFDF